MSDLVKSKQEIERDELERNKKLKPLLGDFVVKEQFKHAREKAIQNKKIAEEKLADDKVKVQCARLAMRAFIDLRFWRRWPLPFDMAWITGRTVDGRVLPRDEMEAEMRVDIGAFSSFLLDEYYNNKDMIRDGKYLHPLLEQNMEFFWQKFVADLKATIRVDQRRRNLGNQGVVIVE